MGVSGYGFADAVAAMGLVVAVCFDGADWVTAAGAVDDAEFVAAEFDEHVV